MNPTDKLIIIDNIKDKNIDWNDILSKKGKYEIQVIDVNSYNLIDNLALFLTKNSYAFNNLTIILVSYVPRDNTQVLIHKECLLTSINSTAIFNCINDYLSNDNNIIFKSFLIPIDINEFKNGLIQSTQSVGVNDNQQTIHVIDSVYMIEKYL